MNKIKNEFQLFKSALRSVKPLYWFLLIALFIVGAGSDITTDFMVVKAQRFIMKNTADSIYSVASGKIGINGMVFTKGVISDTMGIPANAWQVDPSFKLNTYRKTSPTIMGAVNAIDSGVVFVLPGTYNERITAKTNVSIIGVSPDKVRITRTADTACVYGYAVSNFSLKNISIINGNTSTKGYFVGIKLYRCFTDSATITATSPRVTLDNLKIYALPTTSSDDSAACISADSSSFSISNSYLCIGRGNAFYGTVNTNIKLNNMSHPVISDCFFDFSILGHPAIKVVSDNCRPVIHDNRANYSLVYCNASTTLRTWNNMSSTANTNVDEWLSTNNNIVDASFLAR